MKSYLSLVPISAKVHKRQSRMTWICIVLAVFLVTSIISMAEMWTQSELTAMRRNHGDWHIALQNLPENEIEEIISSSDVAYSSWYSEINENADQGYYVGGKNVVIYGVEETYLTDMVNYPAEGSYPQTESEVALSAEAKELFGINIGDQVVINTPAGDFEYTVSGFYEDDMEFNNIIQGCCAYINRTAFDEISSKNEVDTISQFYIRFQKESGLKKLIADLKEQYHLTDENIRENTGVLGLLGASSSETFNGLYPLAAACMVIILAAGVLMISGCMNSNVAQRTSFFGMLRCIGASKQQIVNYVRLEALNWCKSAIPIGCALGTAICWICCAILRFFVKGEWADMPLFAVSPVGILCGAVVGIITVLIAAHSPAKQAAKVSPAAAVTGNTDEAKKIVHAANTKLFKVETSLGINIVSSEGAAKTTMCALLLGAVLNIGLDPLFIYTFNMGVAGAAIATAISQMVSTLVYLTYVLQKRSAFSFSVKAFSPTGQMMAEILKIGIPTLVFQLLTSLSITLINRAASDYGDSVIAGMGAVTRITSMGTLVVFGFLKGFQPIAGFSYGAKKFDRLREAIKTSIIWSTSFCLVVGLAMAIFSTQIISQFTDGDTQMILAGQKSLFANGITFILFGFYTVYSSLFLALGKGAAGFFLGACRQGICFVPVILLLPMVWGMNGILYAQSIADVISVIITVFMALHLHKELSESERRAFSEKAQSSVYKGYKQD